MRHRSVAWVASSWGRAGIEPSPKLALPSHLKPLPLPGGQWGFSPISNSMAGKRCPNPQMHQEHRASPSFLAGADNGSGGTGRSHWRLLTGRMWQWTWWQWWGWPACLSLCLLWRLLWGWRTLQQGKASQAPSALSVPQKLRKPCLQPVASRVSRLSMPHSAHMQLAMKTPGGCSQSLSELLCGMESAVHIRKGAGSHQICPTGQSLGTTELDNT